MSKLSNSCKSASKLNEEDFITRIICEICDYAKANGYGITDTVKAIGESIVVRAVAVTEILNFDNWE